MIQGANASAAFAAIEAEISANPNLYKPDPGKSSDQPGMKIESYKLLASDSFNFSVILTTISLDGDDSVYNASIGFTKD